MAKDTMKSILEATRALVVQKQAEFKSNVAGGEKQAKGLDMAGAGDDSPITRGHALESGEPAKTAVPEKKPAITADANAEPLSTESGTGKNKLEGKEENNQTDRSGTYGSEEAVLTPAKEPAISSDANAEPKQAAALANEILKDIRSYKTASTKKVATKKAENKDVAEPIVTKPGAPVEAAKKKEEPKKEEKVSSSPNLELTTDVLAKIAAMTLATEEGADFIEGVLAKAAGAEAAMETMGFLAEQSAAAEKQAAYEQGYQEAQALIQQAIYQQGVEAGKAQAVKAASSPFAKLGQQVADASINDLMAAGGQGAGVAPEALAGADAGVDAGAEGGISPEELQAALESLVQEGTITPEEAGQVMEFVAQGGDAGAGAGPVDAGAAAPVDEGSAAPAEPASPEKPAESKEKKEPENQDNAEEKEGATKVANLLQAIRELRQARK